MKNMIITREMPHTIEYYWFIAVGAIAGLLGLAGGVRHAHNKAEQTEKVKGIGPRGRA